MSEDNVSHFGTFASAKISKSSPEQRLMALDSCISWISHGKGKGKGYEDFNIMDKLLPKKRHQTPEERARQIEGALDYLRSNNESPDDDDTGEYDEDDGSSPDFAVDAVLVPFGPARGF